jgi:hypothetical protein
MKSDNVTPFNELVRIAKRQGLQVLQDDNELYYLRLIDIPEPPPGVIQLNPYLVMHAASKEEVLHYLRHHRGEHRILKPSEVIGELVDVYTRDEDDDEHD